MPTVDKKPVFEPVAVTQCEDYIQALISARAMSAAQGIPFYVQPNTAMRGTFIALPDTKNLFENLIYVCITPDGKIKQRKKACGVGQEDERPWR